MSEPATAVFLSYPSQDAAGGLEQGDEWDAKIRRLFEECGFLTPVISATTQARHESA